MLPLSAIPRLIPVHSALDVGRWALGVGRWALSVERLLLPSDL
jgi:hypothetical protein